MDFKVMMTQTWFLFAIGFLGMLAHFLKKFQASDLKIPEKNVGPALINYFFKTDLINTLLSVIAYVVVFTILYQQGATSIYSAFSAGFMADSLFNKAEQKGLPIG